MKTEFGELVRSHVSSHALRVYVFLATASESCKPTIRSIEKAIKLHRCSVHRALKELSSANVISVEVANKRSKITLNQQANWNLNCLTDETTAAEGE